MSQLVTFNSSNYNLPTTAEVGWAVTVTGFLADVAANAVDKASTQTITGNKTFSGAVNLTGTTSGLHTLGLVDNAVGLALTLDASNNVVVAHNLNVAGTYTSAAGSVNLTAGNFSSGGGSNVFQGATIGTLSTTGFTTHNNTVTMVGAAFIGGQQTAVAAALTADIGTIPYNSVHFTVGTGTITSLGAVVNGKLVLAIFDAGITLTNNTNINLPGNQNILTESGDTAVILGDAAWRFISYTRRSNASGIGKNKIINGGMTIDQRNVGGAITPAASQYIIDRWQAALSVGSKLTFQQAGTIANAFRNSLKVTVAAQYSAGAAELFVLQQPIEGYNIFDLAWGTGVAQPITISFWAQSSVAGTFGLSIRNTAVNRGYGATYTITTPATPQFFVITIPGDTTGVWTTDTTIGISLSFDLGTGATFSFAAGSWQAASNFYGVTGTTKFNNQVNGSTLFISGVQLEAGNTATPFERRSYQQELALCQRYFCKTFAQGVAVNNSVGINTGEICGIAALAGAVGNGLGAYVTFPVTMRANATAAFYNPSVANAQMRDISGGFDCAVTSFSASSDRGGRVSCTQNASTAIGNTLAVHATFTAEL